MISPDYFTAMGIPIRKGRVFLETDKDGAVRVALMDDKLARQYWQAENPIGKRIRRGGSEAPWLTVVGIAGHIRHSGLDSESKGVLYECYLQTQTQSMNVLARTGNEPKLLAGAVQSAVSEVDKDLPVFGVKHMEQRLGESLARKRAAVYLLAMFAGVALLLAAVGIYGVISQSVTQRTEDIGIRIALEAERRNVLRLVIGQGMTLVILGLTVGIMAALGLTQLLAKLLFGVKAADPATFVGVVLLLAAVAALASYIPARRAAKIDPMIALRYE